MQAKNLLKQIINNSKTNKTLLSIYYDRDKVENFYVGYVAEVYEDSILLYTYDEYGVYDGYLLVRLVEIFKIGKESIYLNKLSFLISQNKHVEEEQILNFKEDGVEGIVDVISICRKNNFLVNINLIYTDYVIGFVTKEDDESFLIETYSNNGIFDGYTLIKYTDIQNVHFKGKEEINIVQLIDKYRQVGCKKKS
jgi:hypothetical protein